MEKIPLEKDILRDVCEYLATRDICFWRSNNVPVYARNNGGKMAFRSLPKHTPRGLPDIMIVSGGVFYAIEIKRPKAYLRPEQLQFRDKVEKYGALYYVVTSVEDMKRII